MIFRVPGFHRAFLLVAGCALSVPLQAGEAPVPAVLPAAEVPSGAETVSLFGEPLTVVPMSAQERRDREMRLAVARAAAAATPNDLEAQIWYGRRAAWLGRLRESVDIFTRSLEKFPDDPRLLRHRGHRYITLRRLDLAVTDLERAARLADARTDQPEPGELSPRGGDTLRSNIWYHLGIARYLADDLDGALRAHQECLRLPASPDREAGTRFWSYLALRRLGRDVEARQTLAPIRPNMAVRENRAYLLLMMMYKGELTPEALLAPNVAGDDPLDPAILRYGVGAWYLVEGRREEAVRIDREVLSLGQWHSFVHIAAEADLRQLEPPSLSPPPQNGR